MSEHGFPVKSIGLMRLKPDGSKSSVLITDEVSASFVTLDGLKQEEKVCWGCGKCLLRIT